MEERERVSERTPEEEAKVQLIKTIATIALLCLVPLIERSMSDPDMSYRLKWHAKDFGHRFGLKVHEAGVALETGIGLVQIQQHLKHKWQERNEPAE